MKQAQGRTTPDVIAEALRDEIAQGRVQPGQALRQDELASRFNVSRIPVREALRRLQEDGLVTVHANRGAFVNALSDEEVVEAFDLRLMLESDLARRSVPRMTASDLDGLEQRMVAAEHAARTDNWNRLDNEFHRALYGPANRPRQLEMVMSLRVLVQRSHLGHAMAELPERWLKDHRRMVKACRRGDADTVATMIETDMRRDADEARARLALQADKLNTGVPAYDEVRWRRAMLDLRPNCEHCDRDLPADDAQARICSFECTFCEDCAEKVFDGHCPNCGGELLQRPSRPTPMLERFPASSDRVRKAHRTEQAA